MQLNQYAAACLGVNKKKVRPANTRLCMMCNSTFKIVIWWKWRAHFDALVDLRCTQSPYAPLRSNMQTQRKKVKKRKSCCLRTDTFNNPPLWLPCTEQWIFPVRMFLTKQWPPTATKATGNYLPGYSLNKLPWQKDPSVKQTPGEIGRGLNTPCHMFHSFVCIQTGSSYKQQIVLPLLWGKTTWA